MTALLGRGVRRSRNPVLYIRRLVSSCFSHRLTSPATGGALRVTAPAALAGASIYGLIRIGTTGTWNAAPRALIAGMMLAVLAATVCTLTTTAKLAARPAQTWMSTLTPLHAVRWRWDLSVVALASLGLALL